MRNVIVVEWMSLDGVIQSAGADDDTTGGFEHGGWHPPYFDEPAMNWVLEGYRQAGGFLFGRRMYELLAGYRPTASEEEQPVAGPLNSRPKYVASTTLGEPLAWQNAFLLKGDAAEAVAALKQEDGGDLHAIGSTQLVAALLGHDLVHGYRLRALRLIEGQVTSTGAILATYARG
jgi:dihydrofolate reductase